MNFDLLNILNIAGSLAFFIYGMKVMSEGIQKVSGNQLRKVLAMMTRNRFLGVFTGFIITAIVQSSSATTVMTVSLANAGLLSLFEAAGLILGANIGTTITSWLISILGFQVKLHTLSIPILAIAVPLLFIKKGKFKFWGEFLIGFSLLFLGLNFLKDNVGLVNNDEWLSWLQDYADLGWLSGLLFVFIGTVLTFIVQSSSAAMALILVMTANGWIPLEVAAAMVLGMNIGTTFTAEIASLIGNVHAKRTARIHTIFNLLGTVWMFLVLPVFLKLLDWGLQNTLYTESAFLNSSNIPIALSAFHTVFNILNVLIFIIPLTWLVNLASKTVSSRGEEDEIHRISYISTLVSTSELSLPELQKKMAHFVEITGRMSGFTEKMLFSIDEEERREMQEKLEKYERITEQIDRELSDYLVKITKEQISTSTLITIRGLMSVNGEIKRVANAFIDMKKLIEKKQKEKRWFNQQQRSNLKEMFALTENSFFILTNNLSKQPPQSFQQAQQHFDYLNQYYEEVTIKDDPHRMSEEYNFYGIFIYNSLLEIMQHIAKHLLNATAATTIQAESRYF